MKPLFPDVLVNGDLISSAAIAAEAQNHRAPRDKPGLAWRAAARALVVRKLLLQAAADKGLAPDPRQLDADKRETEEEALIRAYLDIELNPRAVSVAVEPADARLSVEKIAWAKAAQELVKTLVTKAKITGVDMAQPT